MEAQIKEEITRILGLMKAENDTVKLREYALIVESLVMSWQRTK